MTDIEKAILLLVANGYTVSRAATRTTTTDGCANADENLPKVDQYYSVSEFCSLFKISRTFYYELQRQGRGPRQMKFGRRILISQQAATEWRRSTESEVGGSRQKQRPFGKTSSGESQDA